MDLILNSFNLDIPSILIFILVFSVANNLLSQDARYRLPPGPFRLPFIGTAYLFNFDIKGLIRIKLVFGPIATVYAGTIRVAVISSYKLVREVVINKAAVCSDRGVHHSYTSLVHNPELKGIIMSDFNQRLRNNRSVSLSIFRDLGVGRATIETKILEETHYIVEALRQKEGSNFDPWELFTSAVSNVILSVVLNKRYTYDDPEFLHIQRSADDFIATGANTQMIDGMNWLRYVPPFYKSLIQFLRGDKGMIDYMDKYSQRHLANFDVGDQSDFVNSWLDKHYDPTIKKPVYDQVDLRFILRDLVLAGTETTATSLKWTVIHMANKPDIQKKAQEEIDRVIGRDRCIRLSDREQLPYVEAIMWEVQRFNTIVPLALPHYTKQDTVIGGYDIPKDTFLYLNLYAVHRSKKAFGDPANFRPERFIDASGKFVKHPQVIPFSIGKRSCLGEVLARQELFLFTAALLQNFSFYPPDGCARIEDIGMQNFTYAPKRFKIRALPR